MRFKLEVFSVDPSTNEKTLIFKIKGVDFRTRAFNLSPLQAGQSYMAMLSAETADISRSGFPAVLEFTV